MFSFAKGDRISACNHLWNVTEQRLFNILVIFLFCCISLISLYSQLQKGLWNMLSVLKAVSCAFFLFQQQQQNTISILVVLLEGKVLSNKAEAGILTLLLLVRAEKILIFSHHPFHSFLSQKNVLRIFVKLMQFSHFIRKSLDYKSRFLKNSNL